jgi:hypothetical protein
MLLQCPCPECGKLLEYVSEEVGQTGNCLKCGANFPLVSNPGRVTKHVTGITLFLMGIAGIGLTFLGIQYLFHSTVQETLGRAVTAPQKRLEYEIDKTNKQLEKLRRLAEAARPDPDDE